MKTVSFWSIISIIALSSSTLAGRGHTAQSDQKLDRSTNDTSAPPRKVSGLNDPAWLVAQSDQKLDRSTNDTKTPPASFSQNDPTLRRWGADQNRYEKQLSEIWSRFVKSPRRIDAETDLIEIFEMWRVAPPKKIISLLENASKRKSVSNRARERAKFLLAQSHARTAHMETAQTIIEEMGFLEDWVVVGPFDNEGGSGLDQTEIPELLGPGITDTAATLPGKESPVSFRPSPGPLSHLGYLHLETYFSPSINVCAYGIGTIDSRVAGTAILRVGAGGAFRAFWNGREAIVDPTYRRPDIDRFAAKIRVRKGPNRLVIKVCKEAEKSLGFYARITDKRSAPWDLKTIANQLEALTIPVEQGPPCLPNPQPLEILKKKSSTQKNNPDSLHRLARYLFLTKAIDPTSHLARDVAKSACKKKPTIKSCLLFAKLALDSNERREAISLAEKTSTNSIPVLLAKARLEQSSMNPQRALQLLNEAQALDDSDPVVLSEKALFLGDQGFPTSGQSIAEHLLAKHPHLFITAHTEFKLAMQAGRRRREFELRKQSLTLDYLQFEHHEALARLAVARKNAPLLSRHLEALTLVAPHDPNTYYVKAKLQWGFGDEKQAIKTLESLTQLTPRNADAWKELGFLYIQAGEKEKGIASLSAAYRLKPQDALLSEYLTFVTPKKNFEGEYEIDPKTFLALKQRKKYQKETIDLVDQTVVWVMKSGLSSRFVQRVMLINSKKSARENREQWIQFSENTQRVKIIAARVFRVDGTIDTATGRATVPVSEPWYRLYYDVEAELLEFPPLFPGDVIELKYKIEDIGTRNIFNNYFGDFVFIQDENPKAIWRYVLIRPPDKPFYFSDLKHAGAQIREQTKRGLVHNIFEAQNIAGIRREVDMPGLSSVAPYLHLSSYESWDELGEWYRGLIRNQLVPDQRIKNTVRELTRKAKSPREKAARIYHWVITSTRYVGLEFGIHGFKPYRAPLVVSRGFGDCKDKAALLVTMLKEAGIEAEFILIRTRDLGALRESPASLAVFNHAIVYLPSLDLWLDGTAEHHGPNELPFGDQDANALRLTDTEAIFVRTPVSSPDKNTTTREQKISLDSSGTASLESHTSIAGGDAPRFRRELETIQTRRDRFEAALTKTFPGSRLAKLELSSLEPNGPVTFSFKAEIPQYGKVSLNEMEIPISFRERLAAKYAKLSSRRFDLIIGPPTRQHREVVLEIPESFRVQYLPREATITSPFGDYTFKIQQDERNIQFSHTLELRTHRITREQYDLFADFCRQVDAVLESHIRLGKTP